MAKCKDCFHCEICAKQNRLVQIDAHTWDEYELLDDVEKFCEHFENTADVAPRAEVEKIFDELMQKASLLVDRYHRLADDANDYVRIRHRGVECGASLVLLKISELKKKYTEEKK